ncbi:MAG: diacylglycerol kinase [Thiothrix nivea]|nr:MAG: diacylglycerol kinase [Thiothrix nivea]
MAGNGNTGIMRLLKATWFSWQGFCAAYRHEAAFRQEVWGLVMGTPLALWLGENGIEKALMIGSILLLMIIELLNSAVEATVDRIGKDHHILSGRAKDMGSAAVLAGIVNVIMVWFLMLV